LAFITVSIEDISYIRFVIKECKNYGDEACLVQSSNDISQAPVDAIFPRIPLPITKDIFIDWFLIDENMLFQSGGVVIEQISQRLYHLRHCGCEKIVDFGEFF
jgi:hypothetical protein